MNAHSEENIQGMEKTMANLDTSMSQMLESLESMKPAYAYALQMLEKSSGASSGIEQKVYNKFAYVLEGLKFLVLVETIQVWLTFLFFRIIWCSMASSLSLWKGRWKPSQSFVEIFLKLESKVCSGTF